MNQKTQGVIVVLALVLSIAALINSTTTGNVISGHSLSERDDIYYDEGYVGIGIKEPVEPLHVDGDVRIDDKLVVGDGIGIGTSDEDSINGSLTIFSPENNPNQGFINIYSSISDFEYSGGQDAVFHFKCTNETGCRTAFLGTDLGVGKNPSSKLDVDGNIIADSIKLNPISSEPIECYLNPDAVGTIYFNSNEQSLYICSGGCWKKIEIEDFPCPAH